MKKVLSVLGSFLVIVSSYAQQKPYTLVYSENPPFSMTESGKPIGAAINVIAKLFERAKIPYTLKAAPLARGMAEAKVQGLTCVFPVQRAQSIEADYVWISPIFITDSGLFVHPDTKEKFIVLADVRTFKIGALRGSGDADYLKSFKYNVEEVNTPEQSLEQLLNKRVDGWATDVLSAQYFIQKSGNKERAPIRALTFRRSLGSLACNSKLPSADVATLQSTLDAMIMDGTLGKLTSASALK